VFPTFIHISLQGTYYAVINSYCHLSLTSFTNSYVQHNTTQHNTTQHNTTQHNTTQHNTQHTTQHRSLDLTLNKVALEFYG
jgi:hypothetical protein